MAEKVVLIPARDPKANDEALRILRQLPKLEIRIASESELPKVRILRPSIEKADRTRYYGLHGIRTFVKMELHEASVEQ